MGSGWALGLVALALGATSHALGYIAGTPSTSIVMATDCVRVVWKPHAQYLRPQRSGAKSIGRWLSMALGALSTPHDGHLRRSSCVLIAVESGTDLIRSRKPVLRKPGADQLKRPGSTHCGHSALGHISAGFAILSLPAARIGM